MTMESTAHLVVHFGVDDAAVVPHFSPELVVAVNRPFVQIVIRHCRSQWQREHTQQYTMCMSSSYGSTQMEWTNERLGGSGVEHLWWLNATLQGLTNAEWWSDARSRHACDTIAV